VPGPPGCLIEAKADVHVDIGIRHISGYAIVALHGELALADTPAVAAHLIRVMAAGRPRIIADLAGLQSIGYSGLGGTDAGAQMGSGKR
jgi:anti-anti-sigma regulatory factor